MNILLRFFLSNCLYFIRKWSNNAVFHERKEEESLDYLFLLRVCGVLGERGCGVAMGTNWDLIALRQIWRSSSQPPCPKKAWKVAYVLSGNCKSHIRLYYFQPQKYLPKNQGPPPLGQKENCHSTESRRRPGHSPGTDHDGVLHHDVLSAGNHTPALIHAEVTPLAGWVTCLYLLLLPPLP